jgi:REP element-mobilizing transposase RayT
MPNHVHTIIIIQNTPTPVGCDCIAPEWTNAPEIKNFPWMNNIPWTNNAPLKNIQTHKIKTIKPDNKTLYPTNGTMQSFPTLSRVIRGMKWRITWRIQKESVDWYAFAWQKSFYDIIIRNEDQLHKTRQYICDNPKNWDKDSNNV